MKLYWNVNQVKRICRVQLSATSVSESWHIDCICMLILCYLLSCTPHNSLTVHDIFMQFYRNILDKEDVSHIRMVVHPS